MSRVRKKLFSRDRVFFRHREKSWRDCIEIGINRGETDRF